MIFRLVRNDTDEVLIETPWRQDLGRAIVDRWHEVNDLTVITVRPPDHWQTAHPAREWYGGTHA